MDEEDFLEVSISSSLYQDMQIEEEKIHADGKEISFRTTASCR